MEAILYAEVYLICIIFAGLLVIWSGRSDIRSTPEMWLRRMLISFLLNFIFNFLFTLFNRVFIVEPLVVFLSYALKTLYFLTLVIGVFSWGGYAAVAMNVDAAEKTRLRRIWKAALIIGLAMPIVNLFTHWMFDFGENYVYQRHFLFQVKLAYLFVVSGACSIQLLRQAAKEVEPSHQSHLYLISTFPLCILAALILSFSGEALPVICVSIMVELQCIYMGTTRQQISMDKLTQVNNRQNLTGFINYKLKNHSSALYLLMIDLDDFKQINDTYGHLEGDRALVQLSGVLKRVCGPFSKRPYIARFGGDEFIIVMEGSEADVKSLCENISASLEALNGQSSSYRLCVSIGYAQWKEGMDQKSLIAAADAELYKIKRIKKA